VNTLSERNTQFLNAEARGYYLNTPIQLSTTNLRRELSETLHFIYFFSFLV